MKKKTLLTICAFVLVVALSVAGTVAYLTDSTEAIVNTFTVGNVDITLEETTTNYKMVPGNDIAKNPKAAVLTGSEDCYLFVKIEKSANFDSFMSYNVAAGWTALTGVDGVYYRTVAADATEREFSVLAGDKVTVLDTVTKTMMDNLTDTTRPTLTFTAYAVQSANMADAAAAWTALNA